MAPQNAYQAHAFCFSARAQALGESRVGATVAARRQRVAFFTDGTAPASRHVSSRAPVEPPPLLVVEGGRILWRNMRLELLSREELEAKPREHGVTELAEVERCLVEPDGHISVIKKK